MCAAKHQTGEWTCAIARAVCPLLTTGDGDMGDHEGGIDGYHVHSVFNDVVVGRLGGGGGGEGQTVLFVQRAQVSQDAVIALANPVWECSDVGEPNSSLWRVWPSHSCA